MAKRYGNVGDVKELLKHSEDEEPLTCYLEDESGNKIEIVCDGASSTAGGRATILWFKKRHPKPTSTYQI